MDRKAGADMFASWGMSIFFCFWFRTHEQNLAMAQVAHTVDARTAAFAGIRTDRGIGVGEKVWTKVDEDAQLVRYR